MVTQLAFTGLVLAVAVQRLVELRLSRNHEAVLKARGGQEYAAQQMKWMTLLHGAWLIAQPVEVWAENRPFLPWLASLAFAFFLGGQALRLAAIRSLGDRWCVRVITLPGEPVVRSGIFSKLRHPNYLGVVIEMAALPLIHGAWVTAVVASVLNGLLLHARVRAEEAALAGDEDYRQAFGLTERPSATHQPR